jgi:hypothetical protein
VSFEHFHYVLRNQIDGSVETRRKLLHEILHQQGDVLDPLTERREADRNNVEPVIEIAAEEAKFHPHTRIRLAPQTRIRCTQALPRLIGFYFRTSSPLLPPVRRSFCKSRLSRSAASIRRLSCGIHSPMRPGCTMTGVPARDAVNSALASERRKPIPAACMTTRRSSHEC